MPYLRLLLIISLLMVSAACKTGEPVATPAGAPATCPVPAQDASHVDTSSPPEQITRYDDVIEREFSFGSEGDTLRATLTLPQTEHTAQLPGIVLLQDWGKSTRRGLVQGSLGIELPVEVPLYQTLAHELARDGFAVLRFDKRNCVQDSHPECAYSRSMLEPHIANLGDVLVRDAEQALDALRAQPEVAPARVAVVGHGQGAELALAMTRGVHPPASIVLLSPSMSPIHEVITYQTSYSLEATREQLTRQGDDPLADLLRKQIDVLEEQQRTQKAQFAALDTSSTSTGTPAAIYGLPTSTWQSFAQVHQRAIAALSDASRPATLAILGALDADLPTTNAQRLTEAIGTLPGTRLELLSDTTHDMIFIDEENPDPPTLHPALSTQIAEFLHANLTRP